MVGSHEGIAYVLGLGDSWRAYLDGKPGTILTVNDGGRNVDPDYLIVVDSKIRFTEERWEYISSTEAKYVFTQLGHYNLPIQDTSKMVRIILNSRRGSFLIEPGIIDTSFSSTFVAMNIALWLGHTTIALCGCDLKNHPLNNFRSKIINHLKDFSQNAKARGVRVISIVEDSPMNIALEYVNPKTL